jgi:hypothetical protein
MICPTGEAKYFCKGDWTHCSTKRPTGKSLERGESNSSRVPDAVQRPSRCSAEPGPTQQTQHHDGPRISSAPRREERRAAQRPWNEWSGRSVNHHADKSSPAKPITFLDAIDGYSKESIACFVTVLLAMTATVPLRTKLSYPRMRVIQYAAAPRDKPLLAKTVMSIEIVITGLDVVIHLRKGLLTKMDGCPDQVRA